MNSRKTIWKSWMLGGMMLAGLTACSGDDDMTSASDDGVKVRHLTITEIGTRATLTEVSDGSNHLDASWTAGDALTYSNLSWTEARSMPYCGELKAESTDGTSAFKGDVSCTKGDYLAVVYPATTFSTNTSYTILLTEQDGTLATLATKYHYVFGKANVTEVTDETATATMEQMKSLLSVCKFTFKDGSDQPVSVKSLTIAYGGSGTDADTYPQSATVTIDVNTALENIKATPVSGSSGLTITCSSALSEVYVALLPTTAQRDYKFSVSDGSNTYTGSAKATLEEGKYVEAEIKVTK